MANSFGFIKVDVCSAKTDAELEELVKASVDYWTKLKGYKLISDKKGNPDELTIFTSSAIVGGKYVSAGGTTTVAQTVLVYEMVLEI